MIIEDDSDDSDSETNQPYQSDEETGEPQPNQFLLDEELELVCYF